MARVAALGLVLLGLLVPAAQGRTLDATWSGSWTYRGLPWTFTQSGSTVTGVNSTTNYRLAGTVSGSTLTGKTYGDNTLIAQCEYVKLTLAADGKSFSGYMSGSVTGKPGTTPVCPAVASSAGIPVTGTCTAGACLGNTGATSKPAVLGTWSYRGGAIVVKAGGSASQFVGVVGSATREACSRRVGQRVWTIAGTGLVFSGTHVHLAAPGCRPATVPATFTVTKKGSAYTLRLCTRVGAAPACTTLTRLKPPA